MTWLNLFDYFKEEAVPTTSFPSTNPLEGKKLKYLIGADDPDYIRGYVMEVGYDQRKPTNAGDLAIAYCNLFDETNSGLCGPYLSDSDTAQQYNEGQIDPKGPGWDRNLVRQFALRKEQGFQYIELDNPDAYHMEDVHEAIELALSYGLKVIAKNAGLCDNPTAYVGHRNVFGIIVEKGAGDPWQYESLRTNAGKPKLPVWFVAFEDGEDWAKTSSKLIRLSKIENMFVSYSKDGEYGSSEDINQ